MLGCAALNATSAERSTVAVVCLTLLGICAGAAVGGAVAQLLGLEAVPPTALGMLVGIVASCTMLRRRLARELPTALDGWFSRRRKLRWVWGACAVLAVVNTARLGLFITDPSQVWASAFPVVAESAKHQCVAAYVRAGELAADGDSNLWDPSRYTLDQRSSIDGLQVYLGDPYEYPPTFAVLPRAAVAASDDYQLIRDLWFGIGAVGFLAAFIAAAVWMRGRAGATALLLLPALVLSFPLTFNLQFGQTHMLVVAASIAAMMQFARGRTITGGLLLAFAIGTKLFPALLLVHLAVRRQWRAIVATIAAVAGMTLLATAVLGVGPMAAFVTEHVPRLASGEAFSFAEANPDNVSISGIAFKLAMLGVAIEGRDVASILAWLWTAIAIVLAAHGSRVRGGEPSRAYDVTLWLAIVCLATLRSPFAPGYTSVGTLWLLAVAVDVRGWSRAFVAIAWILLQGAPPVGSTAANVLASLPAQVVTIAIAVVAVWPRRT